jgi:hypothetical protein
MKAIQDESSHEESLFNLKAVSYVSNETWRWDRYFMKPGFLINYFLMQISPETQISQEIELTRARIVEDWNKSKLEVLNDFARYFAHNQGASLARLDKISESDAQISYIVPGQEGGGDIAMKSLKIDFPQPRTTEHEIRKQLEILENEVKSSLLMDKIISKVECLIVDLRASRQN